MMFAITISVLWAIFWGCLSGVLAFHFKWSERTMALVGGMGGGCGSSVIFYVVMA